MKLPEGMPIKGYQKVPITHIPSIQQFCPEAQHPPLTSSMDPCWASGSCYVSAYHRNLLSPTRLRGGKSPEQQMMGVGQSSLTPKDKCGEARRFIPQTPSLAARQCLENAGVLYTATQVPKDQMLRTMESWGSQTI